MMIFFRMNDDSDFAQSLRMNDDLYLMNPR